MAHMTHGDLALPPLHTIAAALRRTTEFLTRQVTHPAPQAPAWSDFEWRIAEASVALQGIAALLANRLRWTGPARWQRFLTEQKRQTQLRYTAIAELLALIDSGARQTGIAVVALKGSALYAMSVYPGADRPMGDIDLLVHDRDLGAATRLLEALGYIADYATWRHLTFAPRQRVAAGGFGEHIGNPVNLELHTRIMERLPMSDTDITALEYPRHPQPGINPYPSVAALMRHLLLHAAGNMRAHALRFIQLHDIGLLAPTMNAGDWRELETQGVGARGLWWAFAPLMLVNRYYPEAIPAAVLVATERGCPWLLRRAARRQTLTEVSWSNARIDAFPGIEWSMTPWDAFRFAASRVWPSPQARADLQLGTQKLTYAAKVPWYNQSHLTRIARWVFSQPPRVQTIHSVRSAMENPL